MILVLIYKLQTGQNCTSWDTEVKEGWQLNLLPIPSTQTLKPSYFFELDLTKSTVAQ